MKILILFGHPAFQNSSVNKRLVHGLDKLADVTFHDLYEAYPEMDIDIDTEQQLLSKHDCIIFQHPLYWYSSPAIFKEWQDLVLEHGWAYGSGGNALKGKLFFNAITTGAPKAAYNSNSLQGHSVNEFLIPFTQMALRCEMIPLPPFVIHGTHLVTEERLETNQKLFHTLIDMLLKDKIDPAIAVKHAYLNELIQLED